MMVCTTFTHPDLDGTYQQILGRSILQSIDPNDGQSSDPRDKSRYQYTLVNGLLLSRRLPPATVGNRWRGERRSPDWTLCDPVPTQWDLLMDWCRHVIQSEPVSELGGVSTGGAMAYQERVWQCDDSGRMVYDVFGQPLLVPVTMRWAKSRVEIHGTDWPQQVACPHCHGWIVWAEAGYVPGYRKCGDCLRHWCITSDSSRVRGWTMKPNGRRY